MKIHILQDTVTQQFFGINIGDILDPMTQEYYTSKQDEKTCKIEEEIDITEFHTCQDNRAV